MKQEFIYRWSVYLLKIIFVFGLGYLVLIDSIRWDFITKYKAKDPNAFKILLVYGDGIGESEQTNRFRIAAKRIGAELRIVSETGNFIDKNVQRRAVMATKGLRPDLVLIIERRIKEVPGVPNYLVLDQSRINYFTKEPEGKKKLIYPEHADFAGLLPSFPEIAELKQVIEQQGKRFAGFIWYPTVYDTHFQTQAPRRVFYPGGILTDDTRQGEKYKELFVLLDKQGYLDVYGKPSRWKHTPNSIRGFLPFDGKTLATVQNQAGISLLLHARDHFYSGTPSGRIFEAVAANTVIISDRHPFLLEHFGDNVLYIDLDQTGEQIFAQVDKHVKWVFAHPKEAQQMAQRCYAVFLEKFTLEQQLRTLIDLHTTSSVKA